MQPGGEQRALKMIVQVRVGARRQRGTRKDRINMLSAEYTAGLRHNITMRVAGNWLNSNLVQDQGLPPVPNIANNRYNPFTGVVTPNQTWLSSAVCGPATSILWTPTAIKRTATYIAARAQNTQLQQDFAVNFTAGPVSIQPIVGWSTYTLSSGNSYNIWQGEAYAYLHTGFFDNRLFLSGGAARIWLDNRNTDMRTHVFSQLKDNTDTYHQGGRALWPATGSLFFDPRCPRHRHRAGRTSRHGSSRLHRFVHLRPGLA